MNARTLVAFPALAVISCNLLLIFTLSARSIIHHERDKAAQQRTEAVSIWLGATSAQAAAEAAYAAGATGAQIAAAARAAGK